MEQKDIDIYEILKGMPDGTPLYTPLCGNVEFTSVVADKEQAEAIWTEDTNGEYAFNCEDEDGDVTVIGKLIDKDDSKGTLVFGKQYEIETEHFVTNETFYLTISLHNELREATENEAELFNKHYSIWEKKEKEAMEQPDFKTFDKVLVRCDKKYKWLPAFFVRDRGDEYAWRYKVLCIHSGKVADFAYCIPFEGHEHLAFTSDPF